MKVNFDGFVPYASSQTYRCARGCSNCSSSQRKDSPEFILDEAFYDTLFDFIQKNNVTYESISFNCCGNFLENFSDFLSLFWLLLKKKILKKWIKILCYSDWDSYRKYASKIDLLSKFKGLVNFQIWISLIVSWDYKLFSEQIASIHKIKEQFSRDPYIQTHIVIQRGDTSHISSEIRFKMLSAIDILGEEFPMTWAESEWILLSLPEIKEWLFQTSWLESCPFVDRDWINVTDEWNFSFYMLDISLIWLRPHWPGCEKNSHLFIGKLTDSIEDLSAWANKLKDALKKMTFDYNKTHADTDICKFCRKNIQNYLK